MKTLLKVLLCFILIFAYSCRGEDKKSQESVNESVEETVEESVDEGTTDMNFEVDDSYKCPMDCEEGKEYQEEGNCPVCGMQLKHVDVEAHDDSDGRGQDEENHEHHEQEGKTDNKYSDD